jgi:hypothetical protein
MSEAAAIEKLDTLIAESQSPGEEAPPPYPLEQKEVVRELEVIYDEDSKITLYHKLKWPTFDALVQRQRRTPQKTERLGAGKSRYHNDDGSVDANAWLWDKFRSQVKGYEWKGGDPDQWMDVSDELAAPNTAAA